MSETGEITRTFEVSGPARLILQNVDGQIDIAAGDEGVISVQAVKHPGRGANQTEVEITQAADGTVSAITHYLEDVIARLFHPWLQGPVRVDYSVRLPKSCEVDVAFVSGQARLQNLAGDLRVRSVSGTIVLEDLAGRLQVNTVSGPVRAARVRFEQGVKLETVSGDAAFEDAFVPSISANAVSGVVRLQTALGAGPYDFRSVSGDVWLSAPALDGCQVDMHALSGRVRAGVPARLQRMGAGRTQMRFEARAGGGSADAGPQLHFNTVSGDLHLVTPQDAARPAPGESAPEPVSAPPAAPDRMAILERIARGELTVDEALSNLKA
jgi:hypothetical protein